MKETWKPVPLKWLSEAFEVSDRGNFRHAPRPVPTRNVQGYRQVTFKYRGEEVTIRAHRLVAMAFLGAPKDGQVVNHKNCKRSDNRVENLEWVTTQENCAYASKMNRLARGLNHHLGKIDPKIAFEMRDNGASYREIGKRFGASFNAASQLINRAIKAGIYKPRR